MSCPYAGKKRRRVDQCRLEPCTCRMRRPTPRPVNQQGLRDSGAFAARLTMAIQAGLEHAPIGTVGNREECHERPQPSPAGR